MIKKDKKTKINLIMTISGGLQGQVFKLPELSRHLSGRSLYDLLLFVVFDYYNSLPYRPPYKGY